jgi:hypothetical protein
MRPRLITLLAFMMATSFTVPPTSAIQTGSSRIMKSSVTSLGRASWRILLSPRDLWFDTSITVVKGSTINLRASGLVNWAPPGDTPWRVGPKGTRPPYDEDKHRFPLPDAGCGSLIMRLGSSTYFVGESTSVVVNEPGNILLMVNDDILSDNSGIFTIDVDVAQSPEADPRELLIELSGLRQTILDKIDGDVESIASGFSNSESILRSLRVAYTFKTVLDTLTGTLTIISEATSTRRLKTSVMGVASPVEYSGSMMALHGAYMNGQTLAFVFDNDRYSSAVSQMLKTAHSSEPLVGFDPLRYSNSIKQSLYGPAGASIIAAPHRTPELCQTVQPRGPQPSKTTTAMRGLTDLRQYVTAEFQQLESLAAGRSYSRQQANELRQFLRDVRRGVIESKSRLTTFKLQPTPGLVSSGCNTAPTEVSLGRVAANHTVLVAAYDALNKNLQIEQVMTVKTVADGIVSGLQVYTKGKGGRTLQTILDVSSKTSLAVDVGNLAVSKVFTSKPEEIIVEKPQEMLLAMPAEGTSLLLLTDVLSQTIQHVVANRSSEEPLLRPVDKPGSGNTQDQTHILDVERIGPGRTPDEKMYQFTVPANQWVETSIKVSPNQEVMVHHFLSDERVTVRLGGLTDSRLQRPGTILPLYTSRNCSADPGVRARVPYTCVQLSTPESIKLFARRTVSVGIYIKGR